MVSTYRRSSRNPSSARDMRLPPSNRKGLVTTATVSALSSRAMLAMIGAPPVPVPPPRPAVTNTISAPWSVSRILSASWSAASRPISGFAPAPSPFLPMWIFVGAREMPRACMSVLTAMNSTPSSPAAIIVLTAFPPPPPTPITLIFAPAIVSFSSSWNMQSPPLILKELPEPPFHPFDGPPQPAPVPPPVHRQIVLMVQGVKDQADARRVHGIIHLLVKAADPAGDALPRGQVQHAFRHIRHALHHRSAAGDHHTARHDPFIARPFDLPRH